MKFLNSPSPFKLLNLGPSLGIMALTLILSGCGNYEEFKEDPADLFTRVAPSQSVTFDQVNEQVLSARCTQCHPGYSDYGTVVAEIDKIVASVVSDRMPQDGPLNEEQKNLLLGWAAAGTPRGDISPIGPNPDDLNELKPTYESLKRNLFGQKCVVCHNPNGQVPFLDLSTREAIWDQRNYLLDFVNPDRSYMVEVIADPFEPMPPLDSPFEQVTEEELNVLKEWIGKGMP